MGSVHYPGFVPRKLTPNLIHEVSTVRAELARNIVALRQYTWTAVYRSLGKRGRHMSSNSYRCRYDQNGRPHQVAGGETGKEMEVASGLSKRPRVRGKAEMQDYIERAITRIYRYVPPDPEQIDLLLKMAVHLSGIDRQHV